MDKLHATIHKASQEVHLDPHTKAGFRRTLEALTAGSSDPAVSRFRLPRSLAWAMAAIIVASTGASVTFASTQSLPGDPLYAVKTKVLEPTESAFALSSDAKARVAVTHLQRRFAEAAALSAAGTLDEHDEALAALTAPDVAAVNNDDQPEAQARFQALAAEYAPTLGKHHAERSRFALAVKLSEVGDEISDDTARATTEEQLTIASQKGDEAKKSGKSSDVIALRLQRADRLARAAHDELEGGSPQAALKLSGAAVRAAIEAQIFASGTSTTSSLMMTTTTLDMSSRDENRTDQHEGRNKREREGDR